MMMVDRVGQQLGNYRLIRLLGRGVLAEVYLGEHLHLDTQVAVKVLLHTQLTSQDRDWLRAEARMLAPLMHPHIVRVLDFDVEEDIPFLVMEYAPNGPFRQRHPKGTRLPLAHIVSYTKQVAGALQYAHQRGVIHCDVKPANFVFGRNQEVLLTDFGLATRTQSSYFQQVWQAAGGVVYTAPELLQGRPGPASDQYALGVTVYEWLSGNPPFSGAFEEIAAQHLSASPLSLCTQVPTIPSAIEQVVLKALAKDPELRFASVQTFAMALEEASRTAAPGRTGVVPASGPSGEGGHMPSSLPDLPRGTVTLFFTDIEGSTHLLQQLDDRYALVLAECRHLLRAAFQRWSGHEIDTSGDAFFVVFARASDAIAAAVEAQRLLASHCWPEGVAVRVRMGLHTGEPSLTPEGYVGLDVHRAARIMSAGHGGQVLLSQTTCTLVEQDLPDDVSMQDLGEHRLKDLGRPMRLFQLVISGLPANFPSLKTLDIHPNKLPVQSTPFIGREQEMATVQHLLRRKDVRLLTLIGPGGTGKTRLGVQVAAELSENFADGVFFVDLAPIIDPTLVVPTIAQTLGIREVRGQTLLGRLKEEMEHKQILLLLDNFEQVMVAAPQVADLLSACSQLKVMVTSREVLHVQAEREFVVPPLALPDPKHLSDLAGLSHYATVALFIQLTQAVKPDFQLTNVNARAVVEICARLDGLPLAIELAAARMKLLPLQSLLGRLSQRLTVLTGGARDVPARQQTLRNTIAWSYNLLDAAEQRLFRRLSVFVGGCTLEAVEAVCGSLGNGAGHVLDEVASLIDKSLLQQTEQEGEEPRFVMLETIREYGLECLTTSGEMEDTQRAHAMYYLALAERAEPEVTGPQQAAWLERLEREHGNLRAAMSWSLGRGRARESMEMALRLGGALLQFWVVRSHYSEGRNFLEHALKESEEAKTSMRAKAFIVAASLANRQGDTDRAEALCIESLALSREIGDLPDIARALFWLADIANTRGNLTTARSLLDEALTLFKEVDDKIGIANALASLGGVVLYQGDAPRAYLLSKESWALWSELGNTRGIAGLSLRLAEVLLFSQGDLVTVRSLIEEGLALFRKLDDKGGIAWALGLLGEVFLQQGDAVMARSLAEESVEICKEIGDQRNIAGLLSLLARGVAAQGNDTGAHVLYEQSLTIARKVEDKWEIAFCLEGLAGVVAAQGEPAWAARLWGAAEALRASIGAPLPPVYRPDYERAVAAARVHLGEKTFAAMWEEGRTMRVEQALAAQGQATLLQQTVAGPTLAPPAKSPADYPDGLTPREVEVLRLVAQGLTDVRVAEQLVISPRTVNTHLKAIYGKIGVSSRSAATRYAMEHKLV